MDLTVFSFLSDFSAAERAVLTDALVVERRAQGDTLVHEGGTDRDMYLVLEGQAHIQRSGMDLGTVGPGQYFGELALFGGHRRAATVVATTDLVVARLSHAAWMDLQQRHPQVANRLETVVFGAVGDRWTSMTDNVGLLLHDRSLPRRLGVILRVGGQERAVLTGTPAWQVLPAEVEGYPVVAVLLDNRAVSLATPLTSDATVGPLTTAHWEGERILRRSVAFLLLAAAADLDPGLSLHVGPLLGQLQWVDASGSLPTDLASRLTDRMRELISADVPFLPEVWPVEEARTWFRERGWEGAGKLLQTWREATVPMVRCGPLYALHSEPLVRTAGQLRDFRLQDTPTGVVLASQHNGDIHLPDAHLARVLRDHEQWLSSLGIASVGDFNLACIQGSISDVIQVAEGFHEKRIGQIADAVAGGRIRAVLVAGPSSSGKTTFIKRLRVQLQVNGLVPIGLSLDDYYRSRQDLKPDEHGEFDYEALEALDVPLLQDHLRRLLAGERVQTARFDFKSGQSHPNGGAEIQLGPGMLLLVEGIHGLNPALLTDVDKASVYRVFVQPLASLPFDRLSRVNPSDLRLIRRIVRDRHTRNCTAADNIARWPSVRRGEQRHIFPNITAADVVFDTSLIYEPSVLKVYAERYLLEVTSDHPSFLTAWRLRQLLDRFVAIYPDHVPPTSIMREFIGGSGFEY